MIDQERLQLQRGGDAKAEDLRNYRVKQGEVSCTEKKHLCKAPRWRGSPETKDLTAGRKDESSKGWNMCLNAETLGSISGTPWCLERHQDCQFSLDPSTLLPAGMLQYLEPISSVFFSVWCEWLV